MSERLEKWTKLASDSKYSPLLRDRWDISTAWNILTDWQREEYRLQKKLDIATKALDDILEFKRTGYFGLNFDVWQIIQKAMMEIEEIE